MLNKMNRRRCEGPQNCVVVSLCGEMGRLMLMVSTLRQILNCSLFSISAPLLFVLVLITSRVTIHTDSDGNETAVVYIVTFSLVYIGMEKGHICECPLSCV